QIDDEDGIPAAAAQRRPGGEVGGDALDRHALARVERQPLLRRHRRDVYRCHRQPPHRQPAAVAAVAVGKRKRRARSEVGTRGDHAKVVVGRLAERRLSRAVALVPARGRRALFALHGGVPPTFHGAFHTTFHGAFHTTFHGAFHTTRPW